MRPIGEVEFVNGAATMAASGQYGGTKVAAGIMCFAELQLGSGVKVVLEGQVAAAPDPYPRITREKVPSLFLDSKFREG